MALELVKDTDSVTGYVDEVAYAYGATIPLSFSAITYAGNTPTTATGITFQLLVKANKSDADSAALVDVTNDSLTITTAPLVVGYDIDTQSGAGVGFSAGGTFYGELWIIDTTYGTQEPRAFQIKLSSPTKTTYP
jgi:hypothetical protein